VTGQVIGHVIEMDWVVGHVMGRLSKQVENEKCTLRKPKNVTEMYTSDWWWTVQVHRSFPHGTMY